MAPSIPNDIYQYSLSSALRAGLRAGGPPVAFLTNHGTHGIGVFADGKDDMVQIDAKAYTVTKDGTAAPASMHAQLPFVLVTVFQPNLRVHLAGAVTLAGLRGVMGAQGAVAAGKNSPFPFALKGKFGRMQIGSDQVSENVTGTVFGFSIPEWQRGISGEGLQCCFISEDRTRGGRVRDFVADTGTVVEWAKCGRFHLGFPQDEEFEVLDL